MFGGNSEDGRDLIKEIGPNYSDKSSTDPINANQFCHANLSNFLSFESHIFIAIDGQRNSEVLKEDGNAGSYRMYRLVGAARTLNLRVR